MPHQCIAVCLTSFEPGLGEYGHRQRQISEGKAVTMGKGPGEEGFLQETGQGQDFEEMRGLGWGGGHGVRLLQGWGPKQDQERGALPHTHPLTPSLPWEENKATSFLCFQAETIGHTYMVASGLPIRNGIRHVDEIAVMSLHFLGATIHFQMGHMPEEKLKLRLASTQVDSAKGRWPCGPDTAADGSKFTP